MKSWDGLTWGCVIVCYVALVSALFVVPKLLTQWPSKGSSAPWILGAVYLVLTVFAIWAHVVTMYADVRKGGDERAHIPIHAHCNKCGTLVPR